MAQLLLPFLTDNASKPSVEVGAPSTRAPRGERDCVANAEVEPRCDGDLRSARLRLERAPHDALTERQRLSARARELTATIGAELGRPVRLKITDNKRVLLSQKRLMDAVEIRAHHVFLRAGADVQRAVARFLRDRDASASAVLDAFLEAESDYLRSARARRPSRLNPRGKVHDLDLILRDVITRHFDRPIDTPRIGWGRASSGKNGRKRSIQLGVYDREEALIRIHRALDREWVPAFYVGFIVYHELLHHLIPPIERAGRLDVHTPEFRRLERKYHYYAEAVAFERANLHRLLAR